MTLSRATALQQAPQLHPSHRELLCCIDENDPVIDLGPNHRMPKLGVSCNCEHCCARCMEPWLQRRRQSRQPMLVERATAIKMDLTANIARVKHALGSLEQEHHSPYCTFFRLIIINHRKTSNIQAPFAVLRGHTQLCSIYMLLCQDGRPRTTTYNIMSAKSLSY